MVRKHSEHDGAARPGRTAPQTGRLAPGQESSMSFIDKAKNKAEELTGQAKEKTGEATGNEQLQAEGKSDQTAGDVKQAGEKVKDVFK